MLRVMCSSDVPGGVSMEVKPQAAGQPTNDKEVQLAPEHILQELFDEIWSVRTRSTCFHTRFSRSTPDDPSRCETLEVDIGKR